MSLPTVISSTTVRCPLAPLLRFLDYHLNSGIDEMLLFFDDPADPALEPVSCLSRVTAIACSADYWERVAGGDRPGTIEERQIANVNEGARIARATGGDWLISVDHDELVHALGDLHEILAGARADAVRLRILEAIAERAVYDDIFEPTLFKTEPTTDQLAEAVERGCRRAIFEGEYFRGHLASKMAFRVLPGHGRIGIHGPLDPGEWAVEDTGDVRLLHYDCIGVDEWTRKLEWKLDGSGTATGMRANRVRQFEAYAEAKPQGPRALAARYEHLYVIPEEELSILRELGMTTSVELDRALFRSPASLSAAAPA